MCQRVTVSRPTAHGTEVRPDSEPAATAVDSMTSSVERDGDTAVTWSLISAIWTTPLALPRGRACVSTVVAT
eukprot:1130116-Prymnesium_polylepis.2